MSKEMERCKELRACADPHYNCAQAVLTPFAEAKGMSTEDALALTSCFGSGMNMGSVCGAVTGGLMALGLCGKGGQENCQEFIRTIRSNHDGMINCRDLLRAMAEKGEKRKPHCDGMVFEALELVEKMLQE